MKTQKTQKPPKTKEYYISGHHAVMAALANPLRKKLRLITTQEQYANLKGVERLRKEQFETAIGSDQTHQGIALKTLPLEQPPLEDMLERTKTLGRAVIIILDQITDPHNVGAILRSAAAFNALCVITASANSASETASLAKAASGALEIVPLIEVSNLARAMQMMKEAGFWCYAMDGKAKKTIRDMKFPPLTALVMGSEGDGLRRLTLENCDEIIRLPISEKMESLNVSNAAAIALYAIAGELLD